MPNGLLGGKIALVLGASAEGGIGWTTAETFAREGAKVIVAARSADKLEKLAQKIGGAAITCDATHHSDIVQLGQRAVKQFGKIDAAVYTPSGVWMNTVESADEKSLREAMELHYIGAFFFVQEMVKAIQKNGAITLISSITSTHSQDGVVGYSCAKGATEILTRYAAKEFAPRQIRVNCVFPGVTATPMVSVMKIEKIKRAYEREIPLGRIGAASDMAEVITFLSSDRARYMTGTFQPVDGGNHLTRLPRADELPSMAELRKLMSGAEAGKAG